MSAFVISGGNSLFGEIRAGGAKNAVLPVIFASVATRGISVVENVPDIRDVDSALSLISAFGAVTSRVGTTLTVDTRALNYVKQDAQLVSSLRASTYLIGACLARFGFAELGNFGGCNFEPRPIDLHIFAMEKMGACMENGRLRLVRPRSSCINFPRVSVGATANALILAASLPTETELVGFAREPHIKTLIRFLCSAGAVIEEQGDTLFVRGTNLVGGTVCAEPDPVETGTYALLSLLSDGNVFVRGTPSAELSPLISPLVEGGAVLTKRGGAFALSGTLHSPVTFKAAPYPALPTDLQPLCAPLLAAFSGGEIFDAVFPRRFGYLAELRRFGLEYERTDGGARIFASDFHAAKATAPDLRGGAALLIPALFSKGQSVIRSSETVRRGYGGIVEKLRRIGAEIYETD